MSRLEPPDYCPVCGARVPPKAQACPGCGADAATGWSERAKSQRLGIPDEEFDYEEFVANEFGDQREHPLRPRGIRWWWWLVALLITIAFLMVYW